MVENESTKKMRTRRIIFYTVLFFFILGLVCIGYAKYLAKHSKKGIIGLHGWVEGDEVTLSSKVTGNIIKLAIDEGYDVKKGDFILQIDSEQITAQLEDASAEVINARESLERAKNIVSVLESKVEGAKIALNLTKKQSDAKINEAKAAVNASEKRLEQAGYNYIRAEKDYYRFLALVKKKKISQSKMDRVEETYYVSDAEVKRAKKNLEKSKASLALAKTTLTEIKLKKNDLETFKRELERARTEIEIAKARLESAKAKKKKIEADLNDTYIYTPVKGTIIEKFVELGEHVVPGTPTVLIIDMDKLYIKTYVEQNYIGKVKYNDPARIYVDSFPGRHFNGKVTFISPKAEFTPRDVQMDEHRSRMVYKIEIGIENREGVLKPGMPADMELRWDKNRPWK